MKDIIKYKSELKIIGDNIKRLRKARGLTQKEVADAVKVTPAYISKIENADVLFSVTLLCKLGIFFDVQPGEIFKT